MQERLTAAQMRQEAGEEKRRKEESKEEVTRKKRSREETNPRTGHFTASEANPRRSEEKKEETDRPNLHMAPPPPGARVKEEQDEWEIRGNKVICYHRKPRKMTFTPVNTKCPINYTKLKSKRVTHCINLET